MLTVCAFPHTHKEQRSAILYAHLGTQMGRSGGRCSLLNIGGFSLCDLWLCSWKAPSDRMRNADNGNRRLILLLLWIQQPDKCLKVRLSKILCLKCSLHLWCSALIRVVSLHCTSYKWSVSVSLRFLKFQLIIQMSLLFLSLMVAITATYPVHLFTKIHFLKKI